MNLFHLKPLPINHEQALEWVMVLVNASDTGKLPEADNKTFKRAWFAIGFLYAGLHPDSALHHGTEKSHTLGEPIDILVPDQRLLVPYYVESGWPVVLEPIANQAWHRYTLGQLRDDEFYCSEAVMAGIYFRDPDRLKKFECHRLERVSKAKKKRLK